jgi:hypothetical protein
MNKKLTLLITLVTLLTLQTLQTTFAQVTQEWVARFNSGGSNNDHLTAMAMDSSGNIIVTGWIQTTDQNANFCTVKYNSAGVQQWVAIYNGPPGSNSIDQAVAVGVDLSGNVFVTGNSERAGMETDDYCTIMYNPQGVQQWVARYAFNGTGSNYPYALAIDLVGNVYVTGESTGSGTGQDFATIKYSRNGDSLWVRRYNKPGNNDYAMTIDVDDQSNVYVGGFSDMTGKMTIIKYNASGVQQCLNDSIMGGGIHMKLKVDNQYNIYVEGITFVSLEANNYLIAKYNNNEVLQWQQTYNGSGNSDDITYDLSVDKSRNVYITGRVYGGASSADYATLKYNAQGVQQWVQIYNGPGNYYDEAFSICLDDSSNVYVTGRSVTGPPPNGTDQFATIKYNTNGVQQWVMTYPGGGHNIIVDRLRSVYVAGGNTGSGTGLDYVIIKYSQLVGIRNKEIQVLTNDALYNNYPNPYNPITTSTYYLHKKCHTRLEVFDALGRKVLTLVNSVQPSGFHSLNFDAYDLSSGIYFYKLETEDYSNTKIMSVIK